MGKATDHISDELAAFLRAQKLFFVATAPLARDGHINLSPKGLDSFRILGPREVAYLDLVGSGVETIAHAQENGRITLLFCAFEGKPKIARLYGRAEIVRPSDPKFPTLAAHFPPHPATRSIVRIAVERASTSCGFGVPRYRYVGERDELDQWAARKGPEGLATYQRQKNARSLDDLPGL
ncbi:MAG: pyridoxamine 5'-phosphate oxidase family protein [Planctomycetes bacterium]|nr:pyridoxamine 5'-phosphate oxidase family protein [Planctomycetota bacterium]